MTAAADSTPPPDDLPPLPSRMFEVAAGLDSWTSEEATWIAANPRWQAYFTQMTKAAAAIAPPPVVPWPRKRDLPTFYFDPSSTEVVGKAKAISPGEVEAQLTGTAGNNELIYFRGPNPDTTVIRLTGVADPERLTLRVGETVLDLGAGFDEYGYVTVRTADLAAILRDRPPLEVVERD